MNSFNTVLFPFILSPHPLPALRMQPARSPKCGQAYDTHEYESHALLSVIYSYTNWWHGIFFFFTMTYYLWALVVCISAISTVESRLHRLFSGSYVLIQTHKCMSTGEYGWVWEQNNHALRNSPTHVTSTRDCQIALNCREQGGLLLTCCLHQTPFVAAVSQGQLRCKMGVTELP